MFAPLIKYKAIQNKKAQLAVALAFAFMVFLAFFAMVYQSSLLVREKIKLQQSTDYAALTGAQIQRTALDKINEINEDILNRYKKTQARLAISPCRGFQYSGLGYLLTLTEIPGVNITGIPTGQINRIEEVFKTTVTTITQDPKAMLGCFPACQAFDSWFRGILISNYERYRQHKALQITHILANTNSIAHDYAVRQIVYPANLPQRLRYKVFRSYGASPNYKQVLGNFKNGGFLKDHLTIISNAQNIPLFVPRKEEGSLLQPRFIYAKSKSISLPSGPGRIPTCTYAEPIPPFITPPVIKNTQHIVARSNDPELSWPSHFALTTLYDPPTSAVEGKFNLKVRIPFSDNEELALAGEDSEDLLPGFNKDRINPRRWPLMSMALAKAYGGEFPHAFSGSGSYSIKQLFAEPGKAFTGTKLIGIADYEKQLEGHTPQFDLIMQALKEGYGFDLDYEDIWH